MSEKKIDCEWKILVDCEWKIFDCEWKILVVNEKISIVSEKNWSNGSFWSIFANFYYLSLTFASSTESIDWVETNSANSR